MQRIVPLIIMILLPVVGMAQAQFNSSLPECAHSPLNSDVKSYYKIRKNWDRCYGSMEYDLARDGLHTIFLSEYKNGKMFGKCSQQTLRRSKGDLEKCNSNRADKEKFCSHYYQAIRSFNGICKDGKLHSGFIVLWDGQRGNGKWVNGELVFESKKSSPLKKLFISLDAETREEIQDRLFALSLYTSTIDGLYGRGTEAALRAYNKQYLNNADLTVEANVDALYADLMKPQPGTIDTANAVTEQAATEIVAEENQTVVSEATTAAKEEPKAEVTTDTMLAAFESQQYIEANSMAQELAADGDATAQYYLGRMFAEGLGTLQISKSAHMWFNIASLNGSAEAVTARNSVADNMSQTAVEEAQEMALLCIQSKYSDCGLTIKPKAPTKAVQTVSTITDGSTVRNDFKAQTALRRKQLQYALKKLGVYSSTVDGLWGNNTSNAFTNYIKINSEEAANAEALFASILSKVDVPTRFAAPAKPKAKPKPKQVPKTYSAPSGWTTFSGTPQMSYEQAEAVCKPIAENAWDSTPGVQYDTTYNCNTWGSSSISCRSSSGPSSAAEGIAAGLASAFAKSDARKRAFRSCMAQYGWKKN